MITIIRSQYMAAVILAACIVFFQSCARHTAETSENTDVPPSFAHILVYPCQDMAGLFGSTQTVLSPLSGKAFETGSVESLAADFMTSETVRLLRRNGTHRFTVYSGSDANVGYGRDVIKRLSNTGHQMGTDAALVGYLYVFEERIGGSYGVEQPARVSFELNLVDTTNGRLVWHRSFSETQQTLNENLFELGKFIKRKGRWITAREMAGQGLEKMLADSILTRTP
jgi:hypothetical protein